MIRAKNFLFFLMILDLCFVIDCSNGWSTRDFNDKAVEKLRQQLMDEKFDQIYDESSDISRAQLSREEFLDRIKVATHELKDVDPGLNWRRVDASPEPAVYRDDNWSSLNLERDGQKVNIQLDWDPPFALCGMLVSGDIPERGNRVFRNCD